MKDIIAIKMEVANTDLEKIIWLVIKSEMNINNSEAYEILF